MTLNVSFTRLAALLSAFLLTAGLWASSAGAQTQHPLQGNSRAQIGGGLPIPITLQPPPNGAIVVSDDAVVNQTAGGAMSIPGTGIIYLSNPKNQPVFFANTAVFQVNTNISFSQTVPIVFSDGKRTGAATVTFCPGSTVPPNGNPACANPGAGTLPGLLRYTATGAQFGGPSQVKVGGGVVDVALRVSAGAPCAYAGGVNPGCQVIFALALPAITGANGAPFGFQNTTSNPGPGSPSGRYYASIGPLGTITNIVQPGLGAGVANAATSYGGPWTTGRLTISQTQAIGSPEIFVISGFDNRTATNHVGSISLVAGAVSDRTLSGPNANRGWINWVVKQPFGLVPALTTPGLAAAIGLLALVGAYFVHRRMS